MASPLLPAATATAATFAARVMVAILRPLTAFSYCTGILVMMSASSSSPAFALWLRGLGHWLLLQRLDSAGGKEKVNKKKKVAKKKRWKVHGGD